MVSENYSTLKPLHYTITVWWHSVNVQIAIAVIGMSAGLMAGVVFAMQYQVSISISLNFHNNFFRTGQQ